MKSSINNGKPIMGSWYSGSGTDKTWHAIIITGYVQNNVFVIGSYNLIQKICDL